MHVRHQKQRVFCLGGVPHPVTWPGCCLLNLHLMNRSMSSAFHEGRREEGRRRQEGQKGPRS